MDNRPFMFGIPVEDSHFIGRHTETERLSANFRNGINTILLSPRRWGKTSLVNKVATMVNSKEIVVVTMDIFSCRNEYDFYNMFSEAILKQTASRMEEWKDICCRHGLAFADSFQSSIRFPKKKDTAVGYEAVLRRHNKTVIASYDLAETDTELYITEQVNNLLFVKEK